MEFRRLTASDLVSLLDLYSQLDANDREYSIDQSKEVWKEIEADDNIQYFGAIDDGKGFNGGSKRAFDMRLD